MGVFKNFCQALYASTQSENPYNNAKCVSSTSTILIDILVKCDCNMPSSWNHIILTYLFLFSYALPQCDNPFSHRIPGHWAMFSIFPKRGRLCEKSESSRKRWVNHVVSMQGFFFLLPFQLAGHLRHLDNINTCEFRGFHVLIIKFVLWCHCRYISASRAWSSIAVFAALNASCLSVTESAPPRVGTFTRARPIIRSVMASLWLDRDAWK